MAIERRSANLGTFFGWLSAFVQDKLNYDGFISTSILACELNCVCVFFVKFHTITYRRDFPKQQLNYSNK